ncbi:FAD-binding oxidoreductase [Neptunomonas sp.]|uniref:ferredoxin reductase family protein n=1 Tax=Neptunomonas sp. TaxID=1971898 RepID=UPI0035665A5A
MSMPNTFSLNAIKFRLSTFRFTNKHLLTLAYLVLLLLPFVVAESLGMLFEGVYNSVLSALNLIAMMAFFVQFPLAGRLKHVPLFANIDWSIAKHKKIGKYLGVFFFLHPLLIVAPKMLLSFDALSTSIISMITSSQLLTGLIAWVVMGVWVLMSVYKDKLNMRYETWRLWHVIGLVVVATLATLHITTVGSHGQYNQEFNLIWWSLYTFSMMIVIYNYLIKPRIMQRQPFAITSIEKVSPCDWQLTIESKSKQRFAFEAGQFAWINTSGSAYNLEQHPFSIASVQNNAAQLSFIIRELGDYTSSLNQLEIGQTVFVDGPYGSMSLDQSRTSQGITLIAGGAGIAPMMSLLRGLARQNDTRPIRLIYGNRSLERMVCLDELMALEKCMANFKLQLVCQQLENVKDKLRPYVRQGLITQSEIDASFTAGQQQNWAVYLCGPTAMIDATTNNLKQLGLASSQIHFEQLAY